MKKILVISPHADDEVLGCGGYLLHQVADGAKVRIIIGTIGGKDKRQDFKTRLAEFNSVLQLLCADGRFLYKNHDAILDEVSSFDLTTKLDGEIDEFRPDEIFVNVNSRHQDHIKMYHCAKASLRLREGYAPKMVAFYEYPFTSDGLDVPAGGKCYHDISDVIDEKIKLFELYKTQIRQVPSPLNAHGVKTLASMRGMECGKHYAELFYIQKMIL